MPIFLSALSALLYGVADFSGGFASRREKVLPVMAISQTAGLAVALICLPFIGFTAPPPGALAFGALAGLAGAFGLFMLYRGLGRTVVAIVSPTSALLSAIIPLIAGAALGERPSAIALAGAALCLPAVFLLSRERGAAADPKLARQALLHGLGAGLGFGLFFVLLSRSGGGNGLWPLISARAASILVFACFALGRREGLKIGKGNIGFTLAAGILDMGANIAFLMASRLGLLMLASAVTSLYPAPTVLLARIFMGQKFGPGRLAGLVLAVAGTALIAMG
jgi:drug/metabolite transporter (DMT)-like permease